MAYIMMIHAMLITLDKGEIAEKLLQNVDAVKQFLIENNWTTEDMTTHGWFTDYQYNEYYGKNNGNNKLTGKGVEIFFGDTLIIAEYKNKIMQRPYISC